MSDVATWFTGHRHLETDHQMTLRGAGLSLGLGPQKLSMTSQDTRVTDLSRLKWVWEEFARKHRGLLFLAICLMAVQGSVVGGISYLMEPMFDRVFVEGARDALVWVGGSIFALFAIRALANSGQRVILCFVTEQIASTMRQTIVAQAVRLDTAYHNSHPPGYMLERVQGDPSIIMRDCSAVVTALGRDAVALVVLMAVAIHVDPIWTLIVVAAAPTLLLPIVLVQRYIRRKSMQARESAARMSLRLDEILHGIATIKLNRLEAFQLGRYARENERRVTTETKSEFGRTLMPAMIDVLTGLGFLGVLIYGGAEIITGEKSVGQFMSFFTAMALAFDPVRRLANLSGALKTAAASVERVQ
ncbi:MAG: ABC transporter transmembrane domain-containing protein, partial [Pseudomonadota bacterium]